MAPFFAVSRMSCNQWRAHANSVASMAKPAGITTTAGPGERIIMMPINSTVIPMINIAMRLANLSMIQPQTDWQIFILPRPLAAILFRHFIGIHGIERKKNPKRACRRRVSEKGQAAMRFSRFRP
jgi:hypothetical protein